MNVRLDETLQAYMKENGHNDLVLYTKAARGGCCGGSFLDVKARFAKENDDQLLNQGYEILETEMGKLYYHPEQIIMGKHPQLVLNRFLGMTLIQAIEISAVDQKFLKGVPL